MSTERTSASAFARHPVANVAIGFDILGFSVNAIVIAPRSGACRRRVCASSRSAAWWGLPLAREEHRGRALQAMCETLNLPFGLELELDKGSRWPRGSAARRHRQLRRWWRPMPCYAQALHAAAVAEIRDAR
jgi:homoserine kinase